MSVIRLLLIVTAFAAMAAVVIAAALATGTIFTLIGATLLGIH